MIKGLFFISPAVLQVSAYNATAQDVRLQL